MEKEQKQRDTLSVSEPHLSLTAWPEHLALYCMCISNRHVDVYLVYIYKKIVIHVMSCENILCTLSVSLTDCRTIMLIDIVCSSQMNGEVNNHPPNAKKAKMKVKHVVLPIEETFTQLLPKDRLSTYIEQEVLLSKCLFNLKCIHQYIEV